MSFRVTKIVTTETGSLKLSELNVAIFCLLKKDVWFLVIKQVVSIFLCIDKESGTKLALIKLKIAHHVTDDKENHN